MAIAYIEKGIGLHNAVKAAGYLLQQVDGVWISSNDQAVQTIINAYDDLPDVKALKIADIKSVGLARIQTVFPAIVDFDTLQMIREFYLSIAVAARAPTTNWTRLVNTYAAGQTACDAVAAATTKAGVEAVVVSWPA